MPFPHSRETEWASPEAPPRRYRVRLRYRPDHAGRTRQPLPGLRRLLTLRSLSTATPAPPSTAGRPTPNKLIPEANPTYGPARPRVVDPFAPQFPLALPIQPRRVTRIRSEEHTSELQS